MLAGASMPRISALVLNESDSSGALAMSLPSGPMARTLSARMSRVRSHPAQVRMVSSRRMRKAWRSAFNASSM